MKFLLIDNHPLFCLGFEQAIKGMNRLHETVTAPSLDEGILLAENDAPPDIVVIEHRLLMSSQRNRSIKFGKDSTSIPWILLGQNINSLMTAAKVMGAHGVLCKTLSSSLVVEAIEKVASGTPFSVERLGNPAIDVRTIRPTVRQMEVLLQLAHGSSNKCIAKQLGITERTVKLHVSALLEKLGARSRMQLLVTAREKGLV